MLLQSPQTSLEDWRFASLMMFDILNCHCAALASTAVWHACCRSRWNPFERLEHRTPDDIMTPDADMPQVGLGPCPRRGQATPGEAAFYCGKYDKCRRCLRPPRAPLSPSYFMKLNLWNSWLWMLPGIRVMGLSCRIPTCLSTAGVDENFACEDTTPSFPLNPEHQLHRGLPTHFFLTGVDRLAWNYFIIQTRLHVQLALVCTAPAEAHSASRRSNFQNLRGWQRDDM